MAKKRKGREPGHHEGRGAATSGGAASARSARVAGKGKGRELRRPERREAAGSGGASAVPSARVPREKTKKARPVGAPAQKRTVAAAKERARPAKKTRKGSSGGTFPIVAIGGAEGGIEAFTRILLALPAQTGMACVFVHHLAPQLAGKAVALLSRHTAMPVSEAGQGRRVQPGHVYVIPARADMSIAGGTLVLSPQGPHRAPRAPIDRFFRSLAADRGSSCIGVILSGNATDGTRGILAIKAAGGITFAQDGDSATEPAMPRSAIATGCVDFVLPPEDIARELARLGDHPYVSSAAPVAGERDDARSDAAITGILTLVRTETGVDFSHYKQATIRRRILRRMALGHVDGMDAYLQRLRDRPPEIAALHEDFLIHVTRFFRDPGAFEALKKVVFPSIAAGRNGSAPIRIWVPGCSSGEEVYSLAIALLEYLDEASGDATIQFFATDISENALEKPRSGLYPLSISEDVSPERLRRFFLRAEGGYRIGKQLRDMCVFARHNIAQDPPFSRMDLISCRNVLMYLGPVLQRRVVPVFHYALKPDGFLLLGSAETVGPFADLFTPVDKKCRVYRRKPAARRVPAGFPVTPASPRKSDPQPPAEDWTEADLAREGDREVLDRYGPPGVVVDDNLNIVQFRGRTSPWLEPAAGAATLNLLRMAREGLALELRNAVRKARDGDAAFRREGLRVNPQSGDTEFAIEVIPIRGSPGRQRRFLILFEPAKPSASAGIPRPAAAVRPSAKPDSENARLRRELASAREYLQSIVEEQAAFNEETRTASEEIQSTNEELQSTNEELETAKEELESSNEELNTVNEELRTRNEQLWQTGNDLMNLLANVSMPIVMLGNDLRIRRFTPICERILNLIPPDVGRPIGDIKSTLSVPSLEGLLRGVIESLEPKAVEVSDVNGHRYSLRVRPYRTGDNRIDGVVMVLVDVEMGAGSATHRDIFARTLIEAQEQERRRLSRELHDDLNQRIAVLELDADALEKTAPSADALRQGLRQIREQVGELLKEVRRIAWQLHTTVLDNLGLVPALESLSREFSERDGVPIRFAAPEVPPDVSHPVAVALYRITQEALRNVSRHSGAHDAAVEVLRSDSWIELRVRDSGIGFDPAEARPGLGLTSMEERARLIKGSLEVVSRPGAGTEIRVRAPILATLSQNA
jgi:two-component system CheB/CheR fusion protein